MSCYVAFDTAWYKTQDPTYASFSDWRYAGFQLLFITPAIGSLIYSELISLQDLSVQALWKLFFFLTKLSAQWKRGKKNILSLTWFSVWFYELFSLNNRMLCFPKGTYPPCNSLCNRKKWTNQLQWNMFHTLLLSPTPGAFTHKLRSTFQQQVLFLPVVIVPLRNCLKDLTYFHLDLAEKMRRCFLLVSLFFIVKLRYSQSRCEEEPGMRRSADVGVFYAQQFYLCRHRKTF